MASTPALLEVAVSPEEWQDLLAKRAEVDGVQELHVHEVPQSVVVQKVPGPPHEDVTGGILPVENIKDEIHENVSGDSEEGNAPIGNFWYWKC